MEAVTGYPDVRNKLQEEGDKWYLKMIIFTAVYELLKARNAFNNRDGQSTPLPDPDRLAHQVFTWVRRHQRYQNGG
ncbi:hypothetical protein OIO90_003052 [Microbotryomycetes sp. JL221]|nr:hypothetical protein OIO90_003052 [Microbotryomycetes sp. JL221]